MRDVTEVEWNRYGYLVKVLHEAKDMSKVLGCTGTIVSPSLVLTSAKCFGDEADGNSLVIYSKGTSYRKRMVSSVVMAGDFAILEFHRIRDEMCPSAPAPVRLSRLPIEITLTSSPWKSINLDKLPKKKCRITGFETSNVTNFSSVHKTLQTDVQVVIDDDVVTVDVAGDSPVCWDDIGVPLECMLDNKSWTQVGLLQSVTRIVEDEENPSTSECGDITSLVFTIFSDETIAKSLEDHTVDVLSWSKKCFDASRLESDEPSE
ncbi:unnamed protein product [Angiostrongylus costaricensis]|uniref:Peptidase S1 domain-containing protein n=1 Tax=Angiostrongylus costaricensis TaxID=334426 RepID=A0A0R3PGE6_ANGCS|nr:unnamed protein product [Angiostrongylus costaricensis]